MPAAWDAIDHVLALDPSGRGIAAIFRPGAALAAAKALTRARRVLIVTGFSVGEGVAETDGPPGAAVLGRALRRLGASVQYVTDAATQPLLAAALKTLDEPVEILDGPRDEAGARALVARERPTHLVAIERPGRGKDGDYLNARGDSVAAWNAPLDEMFIFARRTGVRSPGRLEQATHGVNRARGPRSNSPRGPARPVDRRRGARGSGRVTTVGVGDGGNEIGMGNVRRSLTRQGRLMARIASVVRVDHLVVAGVSNWGAYGIVAGLARLVGQPLLHPPALERRLIEACVEAGGYDGITRRREPTVDALPLDAHAAVVALLGLSWGITLRGAPEP